MKSVTEHKFSQVPHAEIPRSSFDRSHGRKCTFDGGLLIPIFVDECLPGDTFNLDMTGFGRLATPIFPIMDNLFMETFFFAVPIRLLWSNWEKFMGSQDNPGDSTSFLIPVNGATGSSAISIGSLYDHLGVPPVPGLVFNALHARAYNLIWNEWFRDQNLQNSVVVDLDDGADTRSDYALLRRGKRHDYFTSCLPNPQKGTAVSLPLGTSAPILSTGLALAFDNLANDGPSSMTSQGAAAAPLVSLTTVGNAMTIGDDNVTVVGMDVDLTSATAATINQLRQAFQIQKLLERDARGGTRYTEVIRAHFGVTSPDARLQRPEYLGGGSSPISISQVPQTSESGTTALGTLAAYGTVQLHNHGFTKSFTEHCVLLGLISVRADLTYQQGLARLQSRQTKHDFYWPALAHIGEQSVLNKEIWAQGSGDLVADAATFGFQERFAEYRYKPSELCGLFRSDAAGTLDAWHLSQDFAALPVLGDTFIQDNPPIDRVIAVSSEPHFIFDAYFNLRCARPMPMFGVPGMIDHF